MTKDIANNIIQLAKLAKTDKGNVAVSSILPRKDKFNSKARKVNKHLQDMCDTNNPPLITDSYINPHCHIIKGLDLKSYGYKQLTRNFINFIENG